MFENNLLFVTYWPSTQPSSGRRYHLDMWTDWIQCGCDAHKKQVEVKQLYNPVPQTVRVSWSQLQLKFELQLEAVRTSSQQRAWALRTPGWAAQQNEKRSAAKDRGTWGQYVAVYSVSNSPLTHNPFATLSQPFRIKCERYIFLKKCVRSSLLLIMFPHVYVTSLQSTPTASLSRVKTPHPHGVSCLLH